MKLLLLFGVLACVGRARGTCIVTVAQGTSAAVAGDTWANPWDAEAHRYTRRGQTTKVIPLGDMVLAVTGAAAALGRDPISGQMTVLWDALDDGKRAFGDARVGLSDDQVKEAVERWATFVATRLSSTGAGPTAEDGGAAVTLLVYRFTPQGGYRIVLDGIARTGGVWKGTLSQQGGATDRHAHFLAVGSCGEYFVERADADAALNAAEYQQMLTLRADVDKARGAKGVRDAALALEEFATGVDARRSSETQRSVGPPFDVYVWDADKKVWTGERVDVAR